MRRMFVNCRKCVMSWRELIKIVGFCSIVFVKLSVKGFVMFRLGKLMGSCCVVWSRILRL